MGKQSSLSGKHVYQIHLCRDTSCEAFWQHLGSQKEPDAASLVRLYGICAKCGHRTFYTYPMSLKCYARRPMQQGADPAQPRVMHT